MFSPVLVIFSITSDIHSAPASPHKSPSDSSITISSLYNLYVVLVDFCVLEQLRNDSHVLIGSVGSHSRVPIQYPSLVKDGFGTLATYEAFIFHSLYSHCLAIVSDIQFKKKEKASSCGNESQMNFSLRGTLVFVERSRGTSYVLVGQTANSGRTLSHHGRGLTRIRRGGSECN